MELPAEIKELKTKVDSSVYSIMDGNIIEDVFLQIEKDVSMTGLPFEFQEVGVNERIQELREVVVEWLEHNDIRNLLYRIDVSEKAIRQIAELTVEDLCILVLEREFRKVCIRRHFSTF